MHVHTFHCCAFIALSGAVLACSPMDATSPEDGLPGAEPISTPTTDSVASAAPRARPRSAEHLPGIVVTLTLGRSVVTSGDTIEFIATATNTGLQRVRIGVQCGPALDVAIRLPGGGERSALTDLLGSNGAFICPLTESHFADPGETETVRIRWRVPSAPGTYSAVSGLRRADGLGNVSEPVVLTVR